MGVQPSKGGFGKGRYMEPLLKRPFLTILVLWAVVYVPLALVIDSQLPEERHTFLLDGTHKVRTDNGTAVYLHPEKGLTARVTVSQNGSYISVQVEKGHIPIGLELIGKGKLYTSDEYLERRTWELDDGEVRFIEGSDELRMRVDVSRKRTDAMFYRDRGNTIIEGKMLYRDVPTLNPPLINFFWIIPCLLGGSFLVFRLFLGTFVLLSSFVLMHSMMDRGRSMVLSMGAYIVLNPLAIYSTLGAVQDDIIILCLICLSIALYLCNRRSSASAAIGLGIATKLFPVLLAPGILSEREPLLKRLQRTMICFAFGSVPIAVYYVFASEGVSQFLALYITGDSGHELQGISLWRYLGEMGFPSFYVLPILFIGGLCLLYLTMVRERKGFIPTGAFFTLLFLLLFPKVHSGYYLLLLAFVPYYWGDRSILVGFLSASVMVVALDLMNGARMAEGPIVIVPVVLAASLGIVVLYLFHRMYRTKRHGSETDVPPFIGGPVNAP